MSKPPLTLYLAAPRGFCAGVDRAIKIVEMALEKWGAPIYVRHEIVHNKFVVDDLRAKGAVFVEELDECPDDRPVIFSAHGVPKSVPAAAAAREMIYVDATCPLVSKVHIEAQRHADNGLQMIMIGHAGHPETIGTMGQLPDGDVLLVETVEDVATVDVRDPERLAFVTQTTLSVDDTADIVAALNARFPSIVGPHKEDICYATTNRQEAVKAAAPKCDAMLVVGAPNSSNSKRLVEVASRAGCGYSQLVQRATDIDWRALKGISSMGITAGASAPEVLINEVIDAFEDRFDVTIEVVETAVENVEFKVPRVLRERPSVRRLMTDYITFEAMVEPMEWGDSTYTVLRLPEVTDALGKTRRVEGEINDHPVNMALTKAPVIDGVFLYTGKSVLRQIGIEPGERIEVRLRPAPDGAVDVPADVINAVRSAGLTEVWEALTPGKKRRLLHGVNSAKRPETRIKRIAKLLTEVGPK